MATYIGTNNEGKLTYVNEPDIEKTLYENNAEFTNTDKANLNAVTDETKITSTTTSLFGNTVTIYKFGHIVQIDYFSNSKIELTGSSDVKVGTLPTGYRPKVRVCRNLFTSSNSKIQITFNTNGDVIAYNFGSTFSANTGWIRDFYTFIVD